jgi:hypothetical protein
MFPKCYLDYMNSGYRAMPPMPKSSMFPGGMSPGGFKPSLMQGSVQNTEMEIPGGTSSGAPTPGGTPGPAPGMLPGGIPGPGAGGSSSPFEMAPGSPVILDTLYTQGYLKTQIGRRVRITFLLGTNTLQDRTGILKSVGISYVVLTEQDTGTDVLGDIYSIKFVDFFPSTSTPRKD